MLTVRDAAQAQAALAGAPGTLRVIDEKTVYLRMPPTFMEPETLLMVLREPDARGVRPGARSCSPCDDVRACACGFAVGLAADQCTSRSRPYRQIRCRHRSSALAQHVDRLRGGGCRDCKAGASSRPTGMRMSDPARGLASMGARDPRRSNCDERVSAPSAVARARSESSKVGIVSSVFGKGVCGPCVQFISHHASASCVCATFFRIDPIPVSNGRSSDAWSVCAMTWSTTSRAQSV